MVKKCPKLIKCTKPQIQNKECTDPKRINTKSNFCKAKKHILSNSPHPVPHTHMEFFQGKIGIKEDFSPETMEIN
jgi:hypothetical protein